MSIWSRMVGTEQVPATWGAGRGWSSGILPRTEETSPGLAYTRVWSELCERWGGSPWGPRVGLFL